MATNFCNVVLLSSVELAQAAVSVANSSISFWNLNDLASVIHTILPLDGWVLFPPRCRFSSMAKWHYLQLHCCPVLSTASEVSAQTCVRLPLLVKIKSCTLCVIFTILVSCSRDNALFSTKAKINVFWNFFSFSFGAVPFKI